MPESESNLEKRLAELELERAILARKIADYEASMSARSTRWIWRSQRRARAELSELKRKAASLARRRRSPQTSNNIVEPDASTGTEIEHLELTPSTEPVVSFVIPVYGKLGVTQRCLNSIASAKSKVPYEVIVIDDASPDTSGDYLSSRNDITFVQNATNQGYLRSVNHAVEHARGKFVFLLNNDTLVDHHCVDALLDTLRSEAQIGAVGAKLLFPDGLLQEAGSFIWRDGSGHNFGHGQLDDAGDYDFLRDVDYCSAAALMVRRSIWETVGGFDDRYAPAYYEDADLCFAIRAAGWRVAYQPRARVTHIAGASYGSGESSNSAKYQERNRVLFVEKWATTLANHYPSRTVPYALPRCNEIQVMVFDELLPVKDRDSGALRMWRLLDALTAPKRRITFAATSRHPSEPATSLLRNAGIDVEDGHRSLKKSIGTRSAELDLVIVSRPHVANQVIPIVKAVAPHVPVVYDMVDFHLLRHDRGAAVGSQRSRRESHMDEWERSAILGADHIIAITTDEAAAVRTIRDDVPVSVLGNIHELLPSHAAFDERAGLLFVGSWSHTPNRDAVEWLLSEVMPAIWQQLDVALHLVGSGMPEDLGGGDDRVHVHGWVKDLGPLFEQVKASIAPLRFGAGMKGKVGDSLARGVPVVGTTIAAEGFPFDSPGFGTAIDARALADAAIELVANETIWSQARADGLAMIAEHLTAERASMVLDQVVDQLCAT